MSGFVNYVLVGKAKLYKHPKSPTLYVAIPASVVQDSAFALKAGDHVKIEYDPETKTIIISPLEEDVSNNKKSKD